MSKHITTAPLTITIAQPADLPVVLEILREAATWLWDRAIPQWPPEEFTAGAFAPLVTQGAIALAWRAGQAVGTVTLVWSDPEIWGPDDGKAGYVHKLAVKRLAAGQGVSHALLAWADARITAAGRRYARLDCWAGNEVLRRFYTQAGYTERGFTAEATWQCALLEKPVGVDQTN